MAIKSLTVTENAYQALKVMKHGDESFSEVILRLSQEKIGQAARFFGALKLTPAEKAELQKRIARQRIDLEQEFSTRAKKLRKMLA